MTGGASDWNSCQDESAAVATCKEKNYSYITSGLKPPFYFSFHSSMWSNTPTLIYL